MTTAPPTRSLLLLTKNKQATFLSRPRMNQGARHHYVGRNPRNAPRADSDSEGDGDAGEARGLVVAPRKGHKPQHYASREDEDRQLGEHLKLLLADSQSRLASGVTPEDEEDAALDRELARFQQRLAAAVAANHPAAQRLQQQQSQQQKKVRPDVAAARKLREVVAAAREKKARLAWPHSEPGNNTSSMLEAATLVESLEAAILRLDKPAGVLPVILWNAAARPPWPTLEGLADNMRPVPLNILRNLLEEHFGIGCAGLMPLDAQQSRVALLATWNKQETGRGLAFILAPANAPAKDLARLPAAPSLAAVADDLHVLSLGDMLRSALEESTWAYVGTLPVARSLVQAARPGLV